MSDDLVQFRDAQGRFSAWPAKPKKQLIVLQFLAEQFAWDVRYTEQQVNAILNEHHTFEDPALLRRELTMKRFLDRKPDGSDYWRTT